MQHPWNPLVLTISLGDWFRTMIGAVIFAALATNLFDPLVVPIVKRPYGVYRADFINNIDRATDIDRLAGSLGMGNRTLAVHTWVGRNR